MAGKSAIEETQRDRDAWNRMWALVRSCWEKDEDLAKFLGVSRPSIVSWAKEGPEGGHGNWPALRRALRETARRYPEEMPRVMQALAAELFDLRGFWAPEDGGSGCWQTESTQALISFGRMHEAMQNGTPEEIDAEADRLCQEVHQMATVAKGIAAARGGALIALAAAQRRKVGA